MPPSSVAFFLLRTDKFFIHYTLSGFLKVIFLKNYMDIQKEFEAAVAGSKTLSEKPANDVLLQLYALYKQSTEGDVNTDPPSNPFDMVNKAKHSAWSEQKGKRQEDAMKEYVGLVNQLKG